MVQKREAPAGTGAKRYLLSDHRKDTPREKPPATYPVHPVSPISFDEELFARKLRALAYQPQATNATLNKWAQRTGGLIPVDATGWLALIHEWHSHGRTEAQRTRSWFSVTAADGWVPLLCEWMEGVDRICREVWQIQGGTVTHEFVRDVLEPRVMAKLDNCVPPENPWDSARTDLAREIGKLKSEIANRYTREFKGLALDQEERAKGRRQRGPNYGKSRERVDLEDILRSELGTIKSRTGKFATVNELKKEFPDFRLWTILSLDEQQELLTEEFKPTGYARSLVMRKFGLTNPDTIKKDRQKLRKADK